jgi:hypothetical protein
VSGTESLSETLGFPDPLISANLYASGRLDRAIDRFAVPFWRAAEARGLNRSCYIWILRYARCGEHLKLRLHGPESLRASLEALLAETLALYLAGRDPGDEPLPGPQRAKPAPPLDLEDEATEDYPDGIFLHTLYRRSPVVLGAAPLLRDNRYTALFTSCLGRACNLVLRSFELAETGRMIHRRRQALLLKILTAGLSATFPESEELTGYIAYHRDWLVRAPVLFLRGRMAKAQQILGRYNDERTRLDSSSLETLRDLLRGQEPTDIHEEEWRQSLVALRLYLQEIQGLDPDPFVPGPLYPSLFKVFHCVANQLGINPLNEGFAWHLLLNIVRGDGAEDGFRLVPL